MTHKKLLAEIIAQSKESTVQLNSELKEQIQKQTDDTNQVLLEAFSHSYREAINDFTKESAKIQEQQQRELLEFIKKFIDNATENQNKYIDVINHTIELKS